MKELGSGRGEEAVRDMKNRLAAGWTWDELWDRFAQAVSGNGFTYDYADFDAEFERVA